MVTPQRKLDKFNLHIEIVRKTQTQKDLSQPEVIVGGVSSQYLTSQLLIDMALCNGSKHKSVKSYHIRITI
jgi:hypothetical protein